MADVAGFELRDHTADLALYAWGSSLPEMFLASANGLYASIGNVVGSGDDEAVTLSFEAGDWESLLQDFLSELLYRFEIRRQRVDELVVEQLDETTLTVGGVARQVDDEASMLDREVKAVTYHDLEIEAVGGRFEVTVVLDI